MFGLALSPASPRHLNIGTSRQQKWLSPQIITNTRVSHHRCLAVSKPRTSDHLMKLRPKKGTLYYWVAVHGKAGWRIVNCDCGGTLPDVGWIAWPWAKRLPVHHLKDGDVAERNSVLAGGNVLIQMPQILLLLPTSEFLKDMSTLCRTECLHWTVQAPRRSERQDRKLDPGES